jgi:hypothetical protein
MHHPPAAAPDAPRAPTALRAACLATLAFGVLLWAAPGATRRLFSFLLYGDAGVIDAWPPEVRHYVTLQHAVLGALMTGWMVALLLVLRRPAVAPGTVVVVSVAAWYGPDTALSAWLGAWPNVVLNSSLALMFAAAWWWDRRRAGAPGPGHPPA